MPSAARAHAGLRSALLTPLLLLLAASPIEAALQEEDLAGDWDVTWPQSIRRNQDGTVDVLKVRTSRLVLQIDGEGIKGTWEGIGTEVDIEGDVLDPTSVRFRTIPLPDDDAAIQITFHGQLANGELSGTMEFDWPGGRVDIPRAWTAVRARSD
ncbi:MAG: hypothetical protein GKS06_12170 [Acidobacteria bacterium]|nr:hypothetical protein [Acidobacteriota bacterium]